jgi:long-chain acyl-CoA synthetase
MASALAGALEDVGLARGDRVLCDMQNIPQMVIGCLAVWMRAGIVVPVNPMYTAKELSYYLNDSGARVILCQDDLYPRAVAEAARNCGDVRVIVTSPLDLLRPAQPIPTQLRGAQKGRYEGVDDFMELVKANEGREPTVITPDGEDLAYLVYTSGTTGPPKGAMISHRNILYNSKVYELACRLNREDVIFGVAPLFHITGIVAHLGIGVRLGIPIVLFHRFDVGDALRMIEQWRVSFTVAAITVYIALLNAPDIGERDLSSFQKAYSGGAPVSPSTVNSFRTATGVTVYNVYGLTESCSPATITPLGLAGPVDEESGALAVGLIIPGHEAWVVDVEDPTAVVSPGGEGELVLRGPGITEGYWGKPEETAHAIHDRRFFTGDVAKMDEQGWCYIVDRKKDLINVSGFKVWPREVEDALYQHPAVKEAAVVGVPDDYRGETVKAFVSLRDESAGTTTPEELIAFCKERMAAYKYPRQVQIIDEVPKGATGKFLRRELRER